MAKEDISRFLPVTEFIAEILGPDAEVILYSVEDRAVRHVLNPLDDEMVVGSEMRRLERSFLENRLYERERFVVNYRAVSRRKNKLKSATLFLMGDGPEPAAMLTVNVNVDRLIEMRDLLDTMISGQRPYDNQQGTSFYNSFDVSVEGLLTTAIREELDRYHVDPLRLSQKEKLEIVRNLDQKGIFLVKGAISELAEVFQTTETTVYRYLNKLSQNKT
ncbi:transcriptional regulator [uncultured Oscillibacter sp.]|uniref:helix-turn-helix transcriptional regulator n=1 Tax=uncultured Oscillibacter sp. TaxID=876091 RepID=UPI002615B570|nr:helix-turn-helix domain-containing protein [uncultured Oscillibacter sp.]